MKLWTNLILCYSSKTSFKCWRRKSRTNTNKCQVSLFILLLCNNFKPIDKQNLCDLLQIIFKPKLLIIANTFLRLVLVNANARSTNIPFAALTLQPFCAISPSFCFFISRIRTAIFTFFLEFRCKVVCKYNINDAM